MIEVRNVPMLCRDLRGAELTFLSGLTAGAGAAPLRSRPGATRLLCPRSARRDQRGLSGIWRRRARRGLRGRYGRAWNEPAQADRAGH